MRPAFLMHEHRTGKIFACATSACSHDVFTPQPFCSQESRVSLDDCTSQHRPRAAQECIGSQARQLIDRHSTFSASFCFVGSRRRVGRHSSSHIARAAAKATATAAPTTMPASSTDSSDG